MEGSVFTQIVNVASFGKLFPYPEFRPDYVIPDFAAENDPVKSHSDISTNTAVISGSTVVVTFTKDDPENPKNWGTAKKVFVSVQILLLTFAMYVGSSIYTPAISEISNDYGISTVAAILPLSVFVFGYGVGPIVLSPLSEHPAVGRLWIYMVCQGISICLMVPLALSPNLGAMLALRFIMGITVSPALATGGATLGDLFEIAYLPFALAFWSISAICGPVFGPVLGGVFAQVLNWHWTIWIWMIIAAAVFVLLFFCFPETSEHHILHKRAKRLQKLNPNLNYTTEADEEWKAMSNKEVAYQILLRPLVIIFSEPIVFFLDAYIGLSYAILYTWFEAFPMVFSELHGFNLIQTGLTYLGLIVGGLLAAFVYVPIVYKTFTKPVIETGEFPPVALFMKIALIGAILFPISVFMFGWTAHKNIHWIVPTIAGMLNVLGQYFIFQTVFNYLSGSYHRFIASVFAGNGLFRSGMAGAFPLFARAMFVKLGPGNFPVGFGCTVLGCLSALMILIPIVLIKYGERLKGGSKWAN
ncbi:major facilitator superfamily domain-containing protein [Yarrowia lipolytica]|jgi:DHA1 family multidrug resistance protein-like MFS transporter|uniref:YALI0C04499p n=2 Tax=Yarrowia lipolytica TaxID=4952 RepID=Q6CD18_YARLI|nr:YALI0C04499p [Yarrowia lipolytica CLIB122]AOW02336.1 hypothetical protein YALI1_C06006g [Yarrowia lipolytica]KAB8283190.1 major facilitator superfamily domain-containing protein [Yarrowia lipolytica]KAE8173891.1 major facilitator superfamily domain-containing protein [Yarrowia lipolytica]KAJ8053060.1 major facilitator superfamily domain-containing protein [Yarrowia lipolytica]QNP97459.1 Transporter mfs1 [Yarrowia lipolytica]|eukprot:XP_501444.1 YALI0C04499p [Yarrowia lipolytica CLIB122]